MDTACSESSDHELATSPWVVGGLLGLRCSKHVAIGVHAVLRRTFARPLESSSRPVGNDRLLLRVLAAGSGPVAAALLSHRRSRPRVGVGGWRGGGVGEVLSTLAWRRPKSIAGGIKYYSMPLLLAGK